MDDLLQGTERILTPDQRVRVFVSSTLHELKADRAAVRSAILNLKLHPIMFESGARPHHPQDLYRAYLEQSHIYVGIFWKSYGWVGPGMTISGIEDEYDRSAGKPRLVYLKEAPEGRTPELEQLLARISEEGSGCYRSFSTPEELADLVKNDIMTLLSERFGLATQAPGRPITPPAYLEVIKTEIGQKQVINRQGVVRGIKEKLAGRRPLLLTGDPGIGKTFLIGMLGEELDAIYISLRNKTSQQVCSHLANHLSVRRHRFPQSLPSEEEARAALQEELANGSTTLLIDDADQNEAAVRALLGLEYYNCPVVFAVRSATGDLYQGLSKYPIPAFSREEVEAFLAAHKIDLPPGDFQALYSASQGNPLYLYFFSQHQLSPLPEGLGEYQRLLWQRLDPITQEAMNFISFSLAPLNVGDLHALLNAERPLSQTLMGTKQILDAASPLIKQVEGLYDLFHPYFGEFVCSEAILAGLSDHYHRILGEHAQRLGWTVPTAYHFSRANDPRMREYLFSGAEVASLRGEWLLAEEFIEGVIEFAQAEGDGETEAYARYVLAQACQEMGRYKDAREQVDISAAIFDEAGLKEWKRIVEVWTSTLLVEEGRGQEAIETLNEALTIYRGQDEFKEMYVQINLSFACLQVSRLQEGAEAARRALDLATKLGDDRAVHASLLNLAGCVGSLGDRAQQREYAERLIQVADEQNLLRLKAAGLNHLAIVQRLEEDYGAAQTTLEESIAICQQIGSIDREILNIANLGNVFRDQELFDKAERAYTESLVKARQYGFPRQEGHALELLAEVKHKKKHYEEAAQLAAEALAIHERFGDHLRIASTKRKLGRSYVALERKQEAAECYEEAAGHYEITGMFDEAASSYDKAANIWNSLEEWRRAADAIAQGLRYAFEASDVKRARSLLAEALPDGRHGKCGEYYLRALDLALKQADPFAGFMVNFSSYCKGHYDSDEKAYYKSGLDELVNALSNEPPKHLLNALAVGIEQADAEVLPDPDFEALAEGVVRHVSHIHYRSLPDRMKIWTVGLGLTHPIVVQVRSLDDHSITRRLAMAVAIILLANRDLIERGVSERGGNQIDGISFEVMMEKTAREATGHADLSLPSTEELPALFADAGMGVRTSEPSVFVMLHDAYEAVSDCARNPESKAFVWVLMNVYRLLVMYCTHRLDEDDPALARAAREFCEEALA